VNSISHLPVTKKSGRDKMKNKDRKNYQQLDDETLTRQSQQGEIMALDVLLERYRLLIRRYLLSLINDPDAVEDIIQDTFLKVFKSIHQYRGEASFKSWLFVIARNSWKNYLRSHQYQKRINQFEDVYDLNIAAEQCPENTFMQQQQSKLMRIAINALPSKQRKTLSLRINQQLPFAIIAVVMQCSLSTAKANHYFGVKTVERMIAT
jgi:RNA polymerase sigma-70 factor, ECF subfamily